MDLSSVVPLTGSLVIICLQWSTSCSFLSSRYVSQPFQLSLQAPNLVADPLAVQRSAMLGILKGSYTFIHIAFKSARDTRPRKWDTVSISARPADQCFEVLVDDVNASARASYAARAMCGMR
ncbi:hypothetical protein EDD22DRAFT_215020 [Suillus occidentalis]|nr:hypothetical protein EDD22DRAFT_215020 [Suillus occidentalis]